MGSESLCNRQRECLFSCCYFNTAFSSIPKLTIPYHVLAETKEYQELGADYLDQLERQGKEKRLVRQLEKLGFEVALTPVSAQA
jgi:hypothetical protein